MSGRGTTTPWKRTALGLIGVLLLAPIAPSAETKADGGQTRVPDFTKGEKCPADSHDWNLGPTGARGWIHTNAGNSSLARQILVSTVAEGSPADGNVNSGDVILGVGDQPFAGDARIEFARAITAAEEGTGQLQLMCWRNGKPRTARLKLAVMGRYGETAPYDCKKSKRIFDAGCRAIAERGLRDSKGQIAVFIDNDLNALALLASRNRKYHPLLAEYARAVTTWKREDFQSWRYGYDILFLAEYVHATRDRSLMKDLRRLALDIAHGESSVGTWGHFFARPDKGLDGYGCMNLPGLTCLMAMVVAREAGVKDPKLDHGIETASRFLRWYVDKGAIPYGDHLPWPGHEDNGKCSAAAVVFDLLGDREAATFFAKMSTAGYDERERGHTGDFFNLLWALPGVSRCGPRATGAYWNEQGWYYDLAREWDGRFHYQGSPDGEEEHRQYTTWDCTGAYMLTYALPLKSLCITGKKPCSVEALTSEEVDDVIAAGRDYFSARPYKDYPGGYRERTVDQLLSGLSSWSPAVRLRSAQGLARQADHEVVPTLIAMLDSTNRDSRYGACQALAQLGGKSDPAAPKLRDLLSDPDPWTRCLAADALVFMGSETRKTAIPDLLRSMTIVDPADPRRRAEEYLGSTLFMGSPTKAQPHAILEFSLDGVDRPPLYAAIRQLLANEDARIRMKIHRLFPLFTPADIKELLPDIIETVKTAAPSGEMYNYYHRLAGLKFLTTLRIREGITLCADMMKEDQAPTPNENYNRGMYWRWGIKLDQIADDLAEYGGAAKHLVPQLREVRKRREAQKWDGEVMQKDIAAIDKAIAVIESDDNPKPVIRALDYIGEDVPNH